MNESLDVTGGRLTGKRPEKSRTYLNSLAGAVLVMLGVVACGGVFLPSKEDATGWGGLALGVLGIAFIGLLASIFVIAGLAQIIDAVFFRGLSGRPLRILLGVLYAAVGCVVVGDINGEAIGDTVLAWLLPVAFFPMAAILRLAVAAQVRGRGRVSLIAAGMVDAILAILFFFEWFSLWTIGPGVGMDLIFGGISMQHFAASSRRASSYP